MMSSIFYEEIKENRLNTWKENKNPYDILADNNRIDMKRTRRNRANEMNDTPCFYL